MQDINSIGQTDVNFWLLNPRFQLPASSLQPPGLRLAPTALLAFLLYLRTLAPGLLGGDSGEFQFAAWLGGFAHPTGYPLYLLLGWLWTHLLPLHDPAWRMNAFSALWGGVATGLVYLLALRMLRPPSPTLPPLRRGKGELPPLPQREPEKCASPAAAGAGEVPAPAAAGEG